MDTRAQKNVCDRVRAWTRDPPWRHKEGLRRIISSLLRHEKLEVSRQLHSETLSCYDQDVVVERHFFSLGPAAALAQSTPTSVSLMQAFENVSNSAYCAVVWHGSGRPDHKYESAEVYDYWCIAPADINVFSSEQGFVVLL